MFVEYLIIGLVLVLGYAWIGYSLLLMIISKGTLRPGSGQGSQKSEVASGLRSHPSSFSSVSIIVAAHNEEAVIGQRIKNLLSECNSLPQAEIFIGSDGSSDTTAAVAREYAGKHDKVHVFDYKERRGKVSVLKNMVREAVARGQKSEDRGQSAQPEAAQRGGQAVSSTTSVTESPSGHLRKERDVEQSAVSGEREERTEDRGQKSEDRGQSAVSGERLGESRQGKDRGQKSEVRSQSPSPMVMEGYGRTECANNAEGGEGMPNPVDPVNPVKKGLHPSENILVFTDANTEFRPGALEKLLRHFDDPNVGGVCGKLAFKEKAEGGDLKPEGGDGGNVQFSTDKCPISKGVKSEESVHQSLRHGAGWIRRADCIENQTTPTTNNEEPTTKSPSEGFYWRWENWLKERESALDSCLGANGAIYAVREEFFWKDVPDSTIVDDFVIGMKVREQGKKMIYEPEAIAEEEYPETKGEWKRRVRIGAGDYQALVLCRKCLGREYGAFAWSFWSHKVLRWFTPHILILLFALSFFSTGRQGGYYVINYELWLLLMAVFGRAMRDSDVVVAPFFRLFDHFVTMQAALFMGFIRYCKGGLQGSWDRTERG